MTRNALLAMQILKSYAIAGAFMFTPAFADDGSLECDRVAFFAHQIMDVRQSGYPKKDALRLGASAHDGIGVEIVEDAYAEGIKLTGYQARYATKRFSAHWRSVCLEQQ